MDYPEEWNQLSKHQRKEFKRNFHREQQLKQTHLGQTKKYGVIAFISLLVLAGGYLLVKEVSKPQPGEFVTSLGNKHIENITDVHDPYNSIPPTSGTHVGRKASWGISYSPIPDELQLHNLEDGGVMVQYNCIPGNSENTATLSAQEADNCKQLTDQLSAIVKKYPEKVAMAPYPKLDTKIALTAWTRLDKFNDFDEVRIQKFIKAFKGIDHH
ncbi:hypothetical protein A2872_04190 [Candidatus Gottesmanbacteria bacterium RIFCSPHIGHO2_01_FULL_42_12]|uniref:DUF3105 domain-containing protein n=1 Tax=Candidatus Gottesmanbacteria bacterium RIFCSPHIGHO2_01_FULL_42_12 TaxID=1798377 RepID=A0A1F5Z1B7_9BACT|nr:MAG: hypothetical protein A2872_04190 [Candidatus Gottesmanbacteria bacterium RIFCSPHIGHO2_01_FULL_42_12]